MLLVKSRETGNSVENTWNKERLSSHLSATDKRWHVTLIFAVIPPWAALLSAFLCSSSGRRWTRSISVFRETCERSAASGFTTTTGDKNNKNSRNKPPSPARYLSMLSGITNSRRLSSNWEILKTENCYRVFSFVLLLLFMSAFTILRLLNCTHSAYLNLKLSTSLRMRMKVSFFFFSEKFLKRLFKSFWITFQCNESFIFWLPSSRRYLTVALKTSKKNKPRKQVDQIQ